MAQQLLHGPDVRAMVEHVGGARVPEDVRRQPGTETGANVNNTCFGIGGGGENSWVRDGLCSFHISIGEAF